MLFFQHIIWISNNTRNLLVEYRKNYTCLYLRLNNNSIWLDFDLWPVNAIWISFTYVQWSFALPHSGASERQLFPSTWNTDFHKEQMRYHCVPDFQIWFSEPHLSTWHGTLSLVHKVKFRSKCEFALSKSWSTNHCLSIMRLFWSMSK
jgi:hypothetical protein